MTNGNIAMQSSELQLVKHCLYIGLFYALPFKYFMHEVQARPIYPTNPKILSLFQLPYQELEPQLVHTLSLGSKGAVLHEPMLRFGDYMQFAPNASLL